MAHQAQWNTSQVTNMDSMFYHNNKFTGDYCNGRLVKCRIWRLCLHMLLNFSDIPKWDVSNVTNMDSMFEGVAFTQNFSSWGSKLNKGKFLKTIYLKILG